MNQLATVENAPRRAIIEVQDPIPLLDTAQFEHMQRIAKVMAQSTLIPEALYKEGTKDSKQELPYEQILSNCFLVVNQAVRWGMDPFAVAQCVSVVHGKLCYEGKLVSAVLDAKLHLRLHHYFTGAGDEMRIYLSDKPFDTMIAVENEKGETETGPALKFLKPGFRNPALRLFDGSVAEWKTTGSGTPWTPKNFVRMLIYRGTRDWTRIYESAIMLGVYTPDEMLDLSENVRALRARDVADRPSLADRLAAARTEPQGDQQHPEGFALAHVTRETAALTGEPASTQPEDNSQSSDTPADDNGSDGPPSPDQTVAADSSATSEVQNPDEAASEAGDVETQEEPDVSSASDLVTRNLMVECLEKFMALATDETVPEATKRRHNVEFAKNAWKEALPQRLDFVKTCFETADKIVKGELGAEAAKRYLEGLV